jgi:hypothetical protein
MSRTIRLLIVCTVVTFLTVVVSAPTYAQFGLRGGLSVDPDQLYFGVHTQTDRILFDQFQLRPNIEVGFGDNSTVVSLNGEIAYPFQLENRTRLYVGGGPSANIVSFNHPNDPTRDDTAVRAGLNFMFGIDFSENYFAELKVGAIDSPQVKIGFGYTFR